MLALCWFGYSLEKRYGSIFFLALATESLVMQHSLVFAAHVVQFYIMPKSLGGGSDMNCVIGFSGVIFALLVFNFHKGEVQLRTGCRIQSFYLPWVFLIVSQSMNSDVSFIGHFSGMLVAYVLLFSGLNVILPTYATIVDLEIKH